ncbi:hypothetical protein [Spirosoma validum]|uniref:Uncharacterized protein n=1 Tax=Spirosoma validum TaxID=2771355 RepID=A0A927GCM1_9BACT|nr:hypothetical protein [Spirosoma validum]MBD2752783.1 hypothetical protein [Spirosoma validum]
MKLSFMKSLLMVMLSALGWACMDHTVPSVPSLETSWINGWDSQKVLAIQKGQRPDPSVYLQTSYITYQLTLFKNGASYLVTKKALDDYGRDLLGYPDNTQFVMAKQEMDAMLQKTVKNVAAIEAELGIPAGSWQGKPLARIDIPNPEELHVRIPSGNEMGANNLWLPGGKLPTGYSEAVVDRIPKGKYVESDL